MNSGLNPSASPQASSDEPVLDEAIIEELQAMGGNPMVERLFDQFAANYQGRFAGPDRTQIARDAHALVSSAGMLGLTRLSRACARLEKACGEDGDVTGILSDVRVEADAALAAAQAWRRAQA